MNTFSIKFETAAMELDMIVTASEKNRKFKIELVTGEPEPMILNRSEGGEWSIEHPGGRIVLVHRYQDIGTSIDAYLESTDN